jgi:hypothetical protein
MTLLHNVYSSFAVLVDSRLHVYTVLLARHALNRNDGCRSSGVHDDDDDDDDDKNNKSSNSKENNKICMVG